MAGKEHSQCNEETIVDVPEGPTEPLPPPDEAIQRLNKPPSIELEGERRLAASSGETLAGGHADMSAPSNGDDDGRNVQNDLQNTLERFEECLEQWEQKTYPRESTAS